MAEGAKPQQIHDDAKGYEFMDAAPPPDRKQRELIFDSMMKIVGNGPSKRQGRSKSGDHRGSCVATWGAGYHGQLGRAFIRGQKKYSAVPLYLSMDCVVRQVTCGGLHTAAVTESGDVYTWGDGRKGQLGHPYEPSLKPTPRLVDSLAGVYVTQVACGGNHTVAMTDTGLMYSWGWAKYGQTGHGDRTQWKVPRKIDHENAKEIIAIAAGNKHTACVNRKGVAITFGCGEHGQTGQSQSNGSDTLVPTKIDYLRTEEDVQMTSVACGSIHTCFISDGGEIYLCGFGEYFHPNEAQHFFYDPKKIATPEPIQQISCGQSHNIALSTSGNVYTWGSGDYGQLGHGIFGNYSTPRMVLEGKGMAQVAAGRYHSFALSNMGVLYSWGCGENGQLGQNSDENIALPTVVAPILGSVVGQVACGEHHTAVLSSEPWSKLSINMQEWNLASTTEHKKKEERLKKTHRGLTKKDLTAIAKDMRVWQEAQDKRKREQGNEEKLEMQRDIDAIQFDGNTNADALKQVDKTMKLPSVTDGRAADDLEDDEGKKETGVVRLPKVQKRNKTQQLSGKPSTSEEGDGGFSDASQAPITRTTFLKETAQMVRRMKSVVADKGESESNRYLQQMMRLVFEFRKEFDQLKHLSRNRAKTMEDMKKEYGLLTRSTELSKESHQEAYEKLKDLEMQLNTVTIKIAETSENRKNYELNIAHLKEEDFEHFNQLKALRKQNHDNNNFFKKMNELKVQALEEKEKAEVELSEFKLEIESYQQFVQSQLGQFEQILDIVRTQNENREEAKTQRTEKIQARINLRIEKLEAEAESAEKEAGGLTSRLTSLDLKLRHFEDSFQKITAATGLTNPDAIVNKFFFKGEIKEQLQTEIDDKQAAIEQLRKDKAELAGSLADFKSNFREQTWRDVDSMLENQREMGFKEGKTKDEMERVNARLAFVQEGLLTVFKQIAAAQEIDVGDFNLDSASLWTPEQSNEMFAKLIPSVDELLETERDAQAMQAEEDRRKSEALALVATTRKLEHGDVVLDAFGLDKKNVIAEGQEQAE